MSQSLEQQLQASNTAIKADIERILAAVPTIQASIAAMQSQITALQGQLTAGATLTQGDIDAVNALRTEADNAASAIETLAPPPAA